MRDDRQRVDAGIEDAEAAGLPDPFLVRMPLATSSFQITLHAVDRRRGEKVLGRFDGGRIARMPAGKERHPLAIWSALESATSLSVAPGGFSRNTCLPASSA